MSENAPASPGLGPAIASTLAMVLVSMDLFMMPIATTALVNEFQTDAAMVQAAIALFSLVFAGLCILGGKLGDMLGKKKVFVLGLSLYGISAVITAAAPSMTIVIASFALLRAVAVALTIPASVALIVATYVDDAGRGKAFSIYGVGAMIAGLLAPMLMGFMADSVSWRVPFGLEVLVVAAALLMVKPVPETPRVETKVDTLGTFLAFVAIGSVVLAGMLGGRYGWWDARRPFEIGETGFNPIDLSPTALLLLLGVLCAVLLLVAIRAREDRGRPALFSLKLFDNRAYLVAFLMSVVFFVLNGALPFVVPVFLQEAVRFEGSQAGSVMMAFMIGSMVSSIGSGHLVAKMQPRSLMQLGLITVVIGFVWLFAASSATMTVMAAALPMVVVGLGFGIVVTQIPNVQLSTLPAELQGEGSGLAETSKEVGVGLGTAVIGSVLFGFALGNMVNEVAQQAEVQITAEERAELIVQVEDETIPHDVEEIIANAVPDLEIVMREAYVSAFQTTLGILAGIVLLTLLIASLLPNVAAKTESVKPEPPA